MLEKLRSIALSKPMFAVLGAGSIMLMQGVQAATRTTLLPQEQPEPILTKAAQFVGIRTCLPAIAATAPRITAGALKQDLISDWNHEAPDSGPYFTLNALELSGQTVAVSLVAVPTPDGRCSLLVERMGVTKLTCPEFAKTQLAGFASGALLPSFNVYSNPKLPTETISLVSVAAGCMVIRRQASFNLNIK